MRDGVRAAALAAGGFALLAAGLWGAQSFRARPADPLQEPTHQPITLQDPAPHAPACDFWAPWQRLVAPGDPDAYLRRLRRRLDEPSSRSGAYLDLIHPENAVLDGGTESICILGRFKDDGTYQMDAGDPGRCDQAPLGFLDLNMRITVERLEEGGFINDLSLAVGLEDVRPEGVLEFLAAEVAMMRAGYRGWSKAFPAYYALNTAGFGPVGSESLADGATRLRYYWLPQPMRVKLSRWSDYLMDLGDLVTIRSDYVDGDGASLLRTVINTVVSGLDVDVPSAALTYLQAPRAMTFTVSHGIDVRFRGLSVGLQGMVFSGTLTPEVGSTVYEGKFTGVDGVKIDGAYRGVTGGALGDMIKRLVQESVYTEINRLREGNRGRGWTFRLAHETVDGSNVFSYHTALQSPVNFLNLVRVDKDKGESPVLPGQAALQDLNRWTSMSVDALIQDLTASGCAR